MYTLCLATLFLGLWSSSSFAYEVWMGTHLMESSVADSLGAWALTASMLDGVNINRAPDDTNPASNDDWRTIIGQFGNVNNTLVPVARSQISRNTSLIDEAAFGVIEDELEQQFSLANSFNYDFDHVMFYDNAVGGNSYSWTETEAQHMRGWLDSNGHHEVELIWNARNFSQANQNWSTNPLVDHVMIEGSADDFLTNANNKTTLLNWLWTNPNTVEKDVILQIPRSENSMTQFASTRRVAVKLGEELGYENGVQSDRLVFLPVTYNDNYAYLPETTANGTSYTDSLTSLSLSLLEQRPLFEGREGVLPTNADADSFVREPPQSLVSEVSDGSLRLNKTTGTVDGEGLGFVINGDELNVGQSGTVPFDRTAVMAFQLPDLGAIDDPFQFASFQGYLTQTVTSGGIGGDLYGIARRDAPDILNSDYYGLTDNLDPNAFLLQDDFLVEDMATDTNVLTSSVGNDNLIEFLNQQYAGGSGIGDYVFLRLNVDANTTQRWSLSSGDVSDDAQKPQLLYRALDGEPFLIGDFDRDGSIDVDDVDFYSGQIGLISTDAGFDTDLDLDKDDVITLADHDLHITVLLEDANGTGALVGDLNLDGDVDVSEIQIVNGQVVNNGDASTLLASLGNTSGMKYADGDLNGDGDVDVSQIEIINGQVVNVGDASRLLANLGQTTTSGSSSKSAVPEPNCTSLLSLAGLLLIGRRRGRQKAK